MTRQWIRYCKVTMGGGAAIDFSELRLRFEIRQATTQAPGHANVTVTNPKKATANSIKEYDHLTIDAGYRDGHATLFEGEIVQKRYGRENPTDTYLHVLAKEGSKAYSYAIVNKTLAKGHTFRDQVDACLEALKPFGITAGYIADLGSMKMPRGRALFGMVREQLRAVCQSTGTWWRITGNKLEIFKPEEGRPGNVVVLNSRTGLIGMPVQTFNGIEAKCLLNPNIKPGSMVQIDEASIQRQTISPNYSAGAQNALIPSIDADGVYEVYEVIHHGDTRGTDWYTDITAIAKGPTVIPAKLTQMAPSLPAPLAARGSQGQ
jgi:hypothetical protein